MKTAIPIDIFRVLDAVRRNNNIKYGEWAEAAGMPQTRISELKAILNGDLPGRAFTVDKLILLVEGLKMLIGSSALKEEIKARIPDEAPAFAKRMLLVLCVPEEEEHSLDLYLEALVFNRKKS